MRKRPTKNSRTVFYQMISAALVAAARAVVSYDDERQEAIAEARFDDSEEGDDPPPIDWKVIVCAPFVSSEDDDTAEDDTAEDGADEDDTEGEGAAEYEPSEADDHAPSDADGRLSAEAPAEEPLVGGVPPHHPVHAEIAALLPAFAEVRRIVEAPDFAVTKDSIQTAMPVWLSFNGLAKYKGDENFDAIVAFVRSQIKPVCFAAMGKELQESSK
jgi:hypothetical protein